MKIKIYNKKKNPRIESYVQERMELVVGRFSERIGHVDVHLVDENGIKGGVDKICTIDIKLTPRGQLHVRAKHENLYSAIVKAIHRAETVVAKAVDRGHRGHEIRHKRGGVHTLPTIAEAESVEPVSLDVREATS